jgi:hypothetical protein
MPTVYGDRGGWLNFHQDYSEIGYFTVGQQFVSWTLAVLIDAVKAIALTHLKDPCALFRCLTRNGPVCSARLHGRAGVLRFTGLVGLSMGPRRRRRRRSWIRCVRWAATPIARGGRCAAVVARRALRGGSWRPGHRVNPSMARKLLARWGSVGRCGTCRRVSGWPDADRVGGAAARSR